MFEMRRQQMILAKRCIMKMMLSDRTEGLFERYTEPTKEFDIQWWMKLKRENLNEHSKVWNN